MEHPAPESLSLFVFSSLCLFLLCVHLLMFVSHLVFVFVVSVDVPLFPPTCRPAYRLPAALPTCSSAPPPCQLLPVSSLIRSAALLSARPSIVLSPVFVSSSVYLLFSWVSVLTIACSSTLNILSPCLCLVSFVFTDKLLYQQLNPFSFPQSEILHESFLSPRLLV